MKVAILVTLYTTEDEAITQYVHQFCRAIDEINYLGEMLIVGKHRISKRPHTHIHFIVDSGTSKIYKILESRLRRTKALLPSKHVVKYNLSINYDDGEPDKKGHMFDICNVCSYPVKEYDTKDAMVDDLLYIEVGYVWNKISNDDLFDHYRILGNKKWKASEKYRDEKYKNTQKEFKEGLYNYLDQVIISCSQELTDVEAMVRYVVKHVLAHYKNNAKCFNPMQLKAQALNYLYFTDKIDECQICDYMNI